MRHNTQTLKRLGIQSLLQLSRQDSHVRTLVWRIREVERVSKEVEAVYGQRLKELRMNLSPRTCFSKTVRISGDRDLNMSYRIYPKSGTMRNGIVFEVSTLGTRTSENGFTLLPTPVASDAGRHYCDHRALLRYLEAGHQQRLTYLCQAAGKTDSEILELYREVMSYTTLDARYTPLETQLCLL